MDGTSRNYKGLRISVAIYLVRNLTFEPYLLAILLSALDVGSLSTVYKALKEYKYQRVGTSPTEVNIKKCCI